MNSEECLEEIATFAEVNDAMRKTLVVTFPHMAQEYVEFIYDETWKQLRLIDGRCTRERSINGFCDKYVARVHKTYELAVRFLEKK